MKYRIRFKAVLSLLVFVLFASFPSTIRADNIVLGGFDLFATQPGTQVNLGPAGIQPFQGVPLGSFNFGMGLIATFNTDTIVRRLAAANSPSQTVPIEMVALQLVSVNQFNLGAGNGFHFVTLQSARGGPASTGTITINFGPEGEPHGTFTSTLNVAFDIRFGSLDGPILFSNILTLISTTSAPWSHFPPPDAVLIPDVNFLLNGQNQLNDFWPALGEVPIEECKDDGTCHAVKAATIPEPTTVFLLGAGLAGVAAKLRMRSKAKQKHESTVSKLFVV